MLSALKLVESPKMHNHSRPSEVFSMNVMSLSHLVYVLVIHPAVIYKQLSCCPITNHNVECLWLWNYHTGLYFMPSCELPKAEQSTRLWNFIFSTVLF